MPTNNKDQSDIDNHKIKKIKVYYAKSILHFNISIPGTGNLSPKHPRPNNFSASKVSKMVQKD
jgi:hypothetical protein